MEISQDKQAVRKGTPNKRWEMEMTQELISFFAEKVRLGGKPDKSFKKSQMTEAALHINEKFGTTFDKTNVDNHLRTLKLWYKEIKNLLELSGAGWDDMEKKIILDDVVASTYLEAHKSAKPFVNKPIPYYEELRLIVGDDQATGAFAKTVFENFGEKSMDINDNIIHVFDEPEVVFDFTSDNNDDNSHSTRGSKRSTPGPYTASNLRKDKRTRETDDMTQSMRELINKVGEVADAIRCINTGIGSKVYEAVWAYEGLYPDEMLHYVVNFLSKDQMEAVLFLAKRDTHKKFWLDSYFQNNFSSI